jgi:hypothetical protein
LYPIRRFKASLLGWLVVLFGSVERKQIASIKLAKGPLLQVTQVRYSTLLEREHCCNTRFPEFPRQPLRFPEFPRQPLSHLEPRAFFKPDSAARSLKGRQVSIQIVDIRQIRPSRSSLFFLIGICRIGGVLLWFRLSARDPTGNTAILTCTCE